MAYKPKPGKESELLEIVRRRVPFLRGEGLVTDRAIAALQKLLSIPSEGALAARVPLTPALLRLDSMFDPLRNDPRFQELILEAIPKPLEAIR